MAPPVARLLALCALLSLLGSASGVRPESPAALQADSAADAAAAAEAEEWFDPSLFVELSSGARGWSCCRVCPQHHLLEIDQLFGATPPPVRRFDEVHTPTSFLQQSESIQSNCCNVCPTGQRANTASAGASTAAASVGSKPSGYRVPLQNLQFSLSRTPLPPCCPYCRESHLDAPFQQNVRPDPMRAAPRFMQRRAQAQRGWGTSFLEVGSDYPLTADSGRVYTHAPPTPSTCCNRCLRSPIETERRAAGGGNVWEEAVKKPQSEQETVEQILKPDPVAQKLQQQAEQQAAPTPAATPAAQAAAAPAAVVAAPAAAAPAVPAAPAAPAPTAAASLLTAPPAAQPVLPPAAAGSPPLPPPEQPIVAPVQPAPVAMPQPQHQAILPVQPAQPQLVVPALF